MPKWDKLFDEFTEKYEKEGKKNHIAFISMEGPANHELSSRYRVEGYPEFTYLAPGKKGMKAKSYDGPRNDESGMRDFLNRMIEKHDKLNEQLGTDDSSLKDKLKTSLNST